MYVMKKVKKYVTEMCHIFVWMGVEQQEKCNEKMCATKNVMKYVTKMCHIFAWMGVKQWEKMSLNNVRHKKCMQRKMSQNMSQKYVTLMYDNWYICLDITLYVVSSNTRIFKNHYGY